MATNAQIIIKDKFKTFYFYRHWDGNPQIVLPGLNKLLKKLKSGKLRDNAQQFSGHIILLGNKEYRKTLYLSPWKVGAYEPSDKLYDNMCYYYTIDLINKSISYKTRKEYQNEYKDSNI